MLGLGVLAHGTVLDRRGLDMGHGEASIRKTVSMKNTVNFGGHTWGIKGLYVGHGEGEARLGALPIPLFISHCPHPTPLV
jgi:hypothetical protein